MRINQFIGRANGISRRQADLLVINGQVSINNVMARPGDDVKPTDKVALDGQLLTLAPLQTVLLNKPAGYVCSRSGQGSVTIYDLMPDFSNLKPAGRLDKDSSGLLIVTNDGNLANQLTHPKYQKVKKYEVTLDKNLISKDKNRLLAGVMLDDGLSRLESLKEIGERKFVVKLSEGRNRQIRRTFKALGYQVRVLHRTQFGPYKLGDLKTGRYKHL